METERNVCISQRQKVSGCCYISPRDDISHQALSRLPVSNHVSLGSCTVCIGQEGQSPCSAPFQRHTGLLQIALLTKPTMKESYLSQNSLELKLPSRSFPRFYAKQRTVSPEKKKKKRTLNLITPSTQQVQPLVNLQNIFPHPFVR